MGRSCCTSNWSLRTRARRKELVRAWRGCADWCRTRERGLLHYEISQSNKDELTYSIFERYASRESVTPVTPKATEAYKTFEPKMQRLQDAGELKVSGASFSSSDTGSCRERMTRGLARVKYRQRMAKRQTLYSLSVLRWRGTSERRRTRFPVRQTTLRTRSYVSLRAVIYPHIIPPGGLRNLVRVRVEIHRQPKNAILTIQSAHMRGVLAVDVLERDEISGKE